MTVKIALGALYVAVVLVGAVLIARRSDVVFEYLAQRNFPANHRVRAEDLRPPEAAWAIGSGLRDREHYVGLYLDRPVAADNPVEFAFLRKRPVPAAAPGTETYAWFLRDPERAWSDVLDVGWRIDLCAEDACPVVSAPVLAVHCADRDGAMCAVVLQLSAAQKATLSGYPAKQNLRIVVSSPDFG